MPLIHRLLKFFYSYLYHEFAFTYDAVAAAVSFGQWKEWIRSTLPYIQGSSILELGHGPGHLQRHLNRSANFKGSVFGLDSSSQMGHLARRRLLGAGISHPRLVRGIAQELPFTGNIFDTVLSTFPAEFIFDPRTLSEVHRVLTRDGKFVILPAAWPRSLPLKWLFKVTGETPADGASGLLKKIIQPLKNADFHCHIEMIELESSILMVIQAVKN